MESSRPENRSATARTGPLRLAWIAAGALLTVLGIAGLVLPLLPGVPLLIVAAACFARGSPRLERRLLDHPKLGPAVLAWRRDGAIPRGAKIAAFAGMALSVVLVSLSGAPPLAIAATVALLAGGALYVGTRPSRPE